MQSISFANGNEKSFNILYDINVKKMYTKRFAVFTSFVFNNISKKDIKISNDDLYV